MIACWCGVWVTRQCNLLKDVTEGKWQTCKFRNSHKHTHTHTHILQVKISCSHTFFLQMFSSSIIYNNGYRKYRPSTKPALPEIGGLWQNHRTDFIAMSCSAGLPFTAVVLIYPGLFLTLVGLGKYSLIVCKIFIELWILLARIIKLVCVCVCACGHALASSPRFLGRKNLWWQG